MIRRRGGVLDFEERIELVGELRTKFFTTIRDNFQGKTITANPAVEDSVTDCGSLLVRESQYF